MFTSPEAMVEFSLEKNITSALVKNPFSICKKVKSFFTLDVNKIILFQVTLYPLYAKNVIMQPVLVTSKSDRNVENRSRNL